MAEQYDWDRTLPEKHSGGKLGRHWVHDKVGCLNRDGKVPEVETCGKCRRCYNRGQMRRLRGSGGN